MELRSLSRRCAVVATLLLLPLGCFPRIAAAEQELAVTPLSTKHLQHLPAEPLFWQVEEFPTVMRAREAAGPSSLVIETGGKGWLFTLGPMGARRGGRKAAEIGPMPAISAPTYLLQIDKVSGPPGSKTILRAHAGAEVFYVVAGRLAQTTPRGLRYAAAGQSMTRNDAEISAQLFSSGKADLTALVIRVVYADTPLSSAAKLE